MIALAGLLVLVAGALLVGGLGNGQTAMLWGSVGVSALAAAALVLQSVRRARAARADAEDDDEPALVAAAAPAAGSSAARPAAAAAPVTPAEPIRSTPAAPSGPPVVPEAVAGPEASAVADAETVVTPAADVPAPADTTTDAGPAQPVVPPPASPEPPPAVAGPSTGSHAHRPPASLDAEGEPVEEDVEVTDLLLVLDLTDEVEVVDEHPRYHLAGCSVTEGEEVFGLPLNEAKDDGFTACGICRPDRHLADAERRRRAAAKT